MIITTLSHSCDLDSGVTMQPLKNGFITGDMKAHRFEIGCYRGPRHKEVNLYSSAIDAYFVRADGSTVYITGKVAKNMAVIVLPAACYTHAGRFSLVIRAVMDDVKHTIYWAEGTMTSGSTETLVDPGQTIPDLADLLAQIAAMEAATQDADDAATSAVQAAKAANEAAADVDAAVQAGLQQYADTLATKAPVVVETLEGAICVTDVAADMPLQGLHLFGKTTQDGTPTPDNPAPLVHIGAGGSIGVHARGKNLVKIIASSGESSGITYAATGDGGIRVTGTATALVTLMLTDRDFLPAGSYKLLPARSGKAYVDVIAGGAQIVQAQAAQTMPFTIQAGDNAYARIVVPVGETVNAVFYPVIYHASVTDLTFEPYKDAGSVVISMPNGLPGLPVTSGGNYTDADGQMWLCDEIDLAKSVCIKRVPLVDASTLGFVASSTAGVFSAPLPYKATATGYSDDPSAVLMCDTLPALPRMEVAEGKQQGVTLSGPHVFLCLDGITTTDELAAWFAANPTKIIYRPATPISEETPLSAEVIAAYKAMRSTKPNTTVYNDAGAWQRVDCAADTKLYIDKKFNELQSAILSQGANV